MNEKLIEKLLKKTFSNIGFRCLPKPKDNANGADFVVTKGSSAYRVEIKQARFTERLSLQIPPVSETRKHDDFIAIVISDKYVLIEPMKDHLNLCTEKGYRTLPSCLGLRSR